MNSQSNGACFFPGILVGFALILFHIATLEAAEEQGEQERREQLLQANPDDYFDPFRYATGKDAAYNAKVERHFDIASWVFSKKQDDPALRKIMTLLLENGFGIDDYRRVVQALAFAHEDIEAVRNSYKTLGFKTEAEIETILEVTGVSADFKQRVAMTKNQMMRLGITDPQLLKALWSTEIGEVHTGDGSIGRGRISTLWGDRLLTDEDWLEEDFKLAMSKYSGPPRGTVKERMAAWYREQKALRQPRAATAPKGVDLLKRRTAE